MGNISIDYTEYSVVYCCRYFLNGIYHIFCSICILFCLFVVFVFCGCSSSLAFYNPKQFPIIDTHIYKYSVFVCICMHLYYLKLRKSTRKSVHWHFSTYERKTTWNSVKYFFLCPFSCVKVFDRCTFFRSIWRKHSKGTDRQIPQVLEIKAKLNRILLLNSNVLCPAYDRELEQMKPKINECVQTNTTDKQTVKPLHLQIISYI